MYGLICLVVLLVANSGVVAAAISQGYQSDDSVSTGTLVSTQGGDSNKVSPADTDSSDNLLGVVVGTNEATLAVTSASDKLQVATSGVAQVFVSDFNGAVRAGDPITASPIRGVGMKALTAAKIVGTAQSDAKDSGTTVTVKSKSGKSQSAKVGTVPVTLQVAYYVPPTEKTIVPQFLQLFANSVAGKQVSVIRLVASALIVLAATVVIAILLFSAVRTTMGSIGRNPLAQSSIYRGLWQVVFTCLIIFTAALAGSYFVLTR